MNNKARKLFGNCWELFGNLEKSEAEARVGVIDENGGYTIGLSAMQLRNIGFGYGKVFVQLYEEDPSPVDVYNAFGVNSQDGEKIRISGSLAEKMELRLGDTLKIYRILDEQGRILYKCQNQQENPLGRTWEKINQPAQGIVAAIDHDRYNTELYRVGLSAMQLRNLDIERRSEPLNTQTLIQSIRALDKGLLDSQNYGKLFVQSGEIKKTAQIYNASGMRAIGGCGIRISSILAEDLELKIGDIISLRKK